MLGQTDNGRFGREGNERHHHAPAVQPLQVPVVLDRASPVPLYFQLAEQLSASVHDGHLQPGDPFENEVALAQRLELSRPTVRRAIQEMVAQGLVVRRRGLGTVVANRKVHRKAALGSLFDDLVSVGRAPSTRIIRREVTTDENAATALELHPDTPLLALTRVRLADDEPLALMHNWLPPKFSDISTAELADRGLYALLRERGGNPVVARQIIGARRPKPLECKLLEIRASIPVITLSRVAFDASGTPQEFGEHCYRSDTYVMELMLDER